MWLTWKDKLKVLDELDKGGSLKDCPWKHYVANKNVRRWRSQRESVLQVADTMYDATMRHSFLSRQTMNQGRAPCTDNDTLQKILKMNRELRYRDQIFTWNLLVAELKILHRYVQCLSLGAIRRRIWRHIKEHGLVRRHVKHVAKTTQYEKFFIQGWVSYVNHSIKIGNYKACDVVKIDETNVDFDLASGTMLDGRGEWMIGCATTGSSTRCTVLLGVTMDSEKFTPFIIHKGANTPRSLIKRERKDLEARQEFGYREGQVYTVQANAWMDEQAMIKWVDEVWGHYTKDPWSDGWDTYLLQDEFYVHLMGSVNNHINKLGTEVDIIPGGYTELVHVLGKGAKQTFKGYIRYQFEDWMCTRQPSRAYMAQ
jgi:hypothetical protein